MGLGGVGYLNMLILGGVGYGAGSNPLAGLGPARVSCELECVSFQFLVWTGR